MTGTIKPTNQVGQLCISSLISDKKTLYINIFQIHHPGAHRHIVEDVSIMRNPYWHVRDCHSHQVTYNNNALEQEEADLINDLLLREIREHHILVVPISFRSINSCFRIRNRTTTPVGQDDHQQTRHPTGVGSENFFKNKYCSNHY